MYYIIYIFIPVNWLVFPQRLMLKSGELRIHPESTGLWGFFAARVSRCADAVQVLPGCGGGPKKKGPSTKEQ